MNNNLDVTIRRFGPRLAEVTEPVVLFGRRIPRGYVTDGVSVPWFLRWWMDPYGPGLAAAIVHDYELSVLRINRLSSDKNLFRNLCSSPGINTIQAAGAYVAVRFWYWTKPFRGKK